VTPLHAFGLLAGVLLGLGAHASARLPAPGPWLALLLLLALALLCAPCWRRLARLRALRALVALIGGFTMVWWQIHEYERLRLPEQFDERALCNATLEGAPLRRGAELYFTARLESPDAPAPCAAAGGAGALHAALRWSAAPTLHAGERWRLLLALHAPAHAANPGGVDSESVNLRARWHAAGQVIDSPLNASLPGARHTLDYWRERIATQIAAQVSERDAAALIIALAIGDTQRVSPEQWRVFNANGITHLVAISGLHVTLFCLLTSAAMSALWRRVPCLQQRLPRASCAALFGLCASAGYALLSGWSVPAQRTLLMLASWHGLQICARPRRAAHTLSAGLTGVLCLDPLAPLAPGFWLSFLAVAALLLGGAIASTVRRGWHALLHEQGLVAVALLPVTVAVFGSVSLAGLVVNLVAIPFFSLLLVPLILAATLGLHCCVPLAALLLKLCAWLIAVAWPVLQYIANHPAALVHVEPARWWFALATLAVLVAMLPWALWMRASAVLALVPALAPLRLEVPAGAFAATVFDLGSGEATLLRTAHHTLLFDDGEVWGSGGQVSATRLLPGLHYYHLAALDRVILPRLDADRGAGAAALAAGTSVLEFYSGGAQAAPVEFRRCARGLRWQWDGVDFQMLDTDSCALRVATTRSALLLPGSANGAAQRALLVPQLGATAVALIPGHGSRAAWSAALPLSISPRLAILSAPLRAERRAAVAATLRGWRSAGAQLLTTGRDGALELQFQPNGRIDVAQWRKP
jgi:competence protein ComEC